MKSLGKIVMMLLIGLTEAVVIYPFLHESGHIAVALVVGGEIIEYSLFPVPNILCDVRKVVEIGQVFTGIGGILLPIAITTVLHTQKHFLAWYGNLMLRVICVLSVAITAAASFLYAAGKPVANEDITTVLEIAPKLFGIVLTVSLLLLAFLIIIIARDKPVNRISDYLLN